MSFRLLAGPAPQVAAANALLRLCSRVDPGGDPQAWCQRDFVRQLRPLLTTLSPGSPLREVDLTVLLLQALPPCVHTGPPNSLDPFDSAHAAVFNLVGYRTADDAARRVERGVL